ncbi:proprotein convertase P-domain-containing protein, partial [bacterium]|nr:proprotein convertase P-domain-containing protein [bacterium]
MKLRNYTFFFFFIFLLSCGADKTMMPPESGGECSDKGQKVCSESYIEVLQCGNDSRWHTIAICQTMQGEYCIESDETAFCNSAHETPDDDDTIIIPDEDKTTIDDDNSIVDEDNTLTDEDEILLDNDTSDDSDIDEQHDEDTPTGPYCGDKNIDAIYDDIQQKQSNNSQLSIRDDAITDNILTVSQDGDITGLSYQFHITHGHAADLTVELISPRGTIHAICSECTNTELQNRDEIVTTFDDEKSIGEWKLRVTDNNFGNSGMIFYFRLTLDLYVFVSSEECDDGNKITEKCAYGETACTVCDETCKNIDGATTFCGDNIIDSGNENCDDGINDGSYNSCNADCQSLANFCGDSLITDAEICDDGINDGTYGHCNADCLSMGKFCGDSIATDSESCDDGINDGSYGHCNADCLSMANHCGDSLITDSESCDDGINDGSYGHCSIDCLSMGNFCGDSATTDAEVCDDGINDGTYGYCNADCLAMGNYCGDSATTDAEICDDGINDGTYGHCNADCLAMGNYCGDSATTDAEICDDGINDGTYGYCNGDCLAMGHHCGDLLITDAE